MITTHARKQGLEIEELVSTTDIDDVTEHEIDDAVAELACVGSIEHATDQACEFVEQGKARLEVLPDNETRELLCDIADYIIERNY